MKQLFRDLTPGQRGAALGGLLLILALSGLVGLTIAAATLTGGLPPVLDGIVQGGGMTVAFGATIVLGAGFCCPWIVTGAFGALAAGACRAPS